MDDMARVAVEMLIAANRPDAEPVPEQSLHRVPPHEVVVRDSTSAPLVRTTKLAKVAKGIKAVRAVRAVKAAKATQASGPARPAR